MYKNLTITAVFGVIAVVLGAFGAHALKSKLSPEALQSFETAVRYQFIHVLVLLFINTFQEFSLQQKNRISRFFIAGIVLFSGSIYLIQLAGISAKSIWFITPLGGVLLIIGWSLMIFEFIKKISKKTI
ncbi:DUF423 domain-containing protein [Tenacibaculum piscium]|uniref:DUF423 domain-containing protein n=1 Tax=Tenacibaculum piscium TaxID=1458515 RepID=A0A2H1YIM6_9FLAO|nr:DUF423 domain-containing protein [Tenacibaculum piscium]MBE7628576.1 DUF423 domain-containing protein [Tenacibaculum piscium]MBE7669717.1 DUF423 domain-containing protein [Tenacibaculum piscium]MBE7684695.1 DUF423 domain-containing protein [Tenacibaculum piscium]MBE7689315.1 DUF423 domain-containing protein [Tenacibaculum piscium]MCG8182806.1 DUF423 domain-containing protein [Tenacibaculum piscium]